MTPTAFGQTVIACALSIDQNKELRVTRMLNTTNELYGKDFVNTFDKEPRLEKLWKKNLFP